MESVQDCKESLEKSEANYDSSPEGQTSGDEIESLRFKDYLDRAFEKRLNNILDFEAYMLTSFILDNNSDFHVMWNFRREILLYWKKHGLVNDVNIKNLRCRVYFEGYNDHELFTILDFVQNTLTGSEEIEFDKIFLEELSFTLKCLIRHLKSYATWNHRMTIIKWMKKPPLEAELDTCRDCFSLDPRNFHCWNYRKFICEKLYGKDTGITNQLNFIKSMIKKNPDNFSAFHYQSVLLNQLKEEGLLGGDAASLEYQNYWNNEFDSIKSSLLNISSLQGLWLYFWWLCLMRFDMQKPESSNVISNPYIHRIILDNDGHIIVYQFNQFLHQPPFNQVTFISTSGISTHYSIKEWSSIGSLTSDVWFHKVGDEVDCGNIAEIMFTYLNETQLIAIAPFNSSNLSFTTINELPKSRFDLLQLTQSNDWVNDICEQSNDSQVIMEFNRYLTLTKTLLNGKNFDQLPIIDPLRRNFYNDLQSSYKIKKKLQSEDPFESQLSLQKLSLTCVHPISHLTHLRSLDLSNNELTRVNGSFNTLIVLQSLILDSNYISTIDSSFKMISLKTLSLKNNRISDKFALKACNDSQQLKLINIAGNSIADADLNELQLEPRIVIAR